MNATFELIDKNHTLRKLEFEAETPSTPMHSAPSHEQRCVTATSSETGSYEIASSLHIRQSLKSREFLKSSWDMSLRAVITSISDVCMCASVVG